MIHSPVREEDKLKFSLSLAEVVVEQIWVVGVVVEV